MVLLDKNVRYAICTVTEQGKKVALELQKKLSYDQAKVYVTEKLAVDDDRVIPMVGGTPMWIGKLFNEVDVLVCIIAAGAVVRAIAPVLKNKMTDPAVIVMDQQCRNVISLLSGHLGGANDYTYEIAHLMHANPVVTTATDVQNVWALDMLAKSLNAWRPELKEELLRFNSRLVASEPVYIYQEKEWITDLKGLIPITKDELEEYLNSDNYLFYLTTEPTDMKREGLAVIYPKPYILGTGSRKDVDPAVYRKNFETFCQMHNISETEIAMIVSIDVKKEEKCMLQLADELGVPFETFTRDQLATVSYKYPQSQKVMDTVGVGSVSLAAADFASNGKVITQRFANEGCTYALAKF